MIITKSQQIIIASLAMDLLRMALGLHRGSLSMASRFRQEALKRQQELESQRVDHRIKKLLTNVKAVLNSNNERVVEDALIYSVLFQNLARQISPMNPN